MAIYALWNNKGGVGKSYLTFQIASEYARTHPQQKVLVIDLCPQSNSSSMLLGGMEAGDDSLSELSQTQPPKTISGYIGDRIVSPYVNPNTGANYLTKINNHNPHVPENLYLVCGDDLLEIQSPQVQMACGAGPQDAWRIVHTWVSDLINDIKTSWGSSDITVFIDCNPSFTIYTELAMSASQRLIIPFSADGSSKRAVKSLLSLVYGVQRHPGQRQSDFVIRSNQYRMTVPYIYGYVGNRLTQMNSSSATAFKKVVREIFDEIFAVWQHTPQFFYVGQNASSAPTNRQTFRQVFEKEINDANTASVVSGALGIPMCRLTAGYYDFFGRGDVQVNQSQLDKQQPNIRDFVASIE